MRVRFAGVALWLILLPGFLWSQASFQLGTAVESELPAGPTTFSPLGAAAVDLYLYRDQENSLLTSIDGNASATPSTGFAGGDLSLGLDASVVHGTTRYDAGFFGSISGDTTTGLSALQAGARGGLSTGNLDYSVALRPSITRSFAPLAGWVPALSTRIDLRLGPSLTGSIRASLSAVGYDSGDAAWSITGGPGLTWYMGNAAVLDLSLGAAVSRSTLTTPLSDLGATGIAATTPVHDGTYSGLEWLAEWDVAAAQRVRLFVSVPGYFRVMEYNHYSGGALSAPAEWLVQLSPRIGIAVDVTNDLSINLEPEINLTYSNSDYRRATTFSTSVYAQLQF
ncbi:MAG TPA: hypothetical protein VMW87_06615 [Spirochaetia bacterium]|nr:hypothetical protein [Spirochaetia bacterium]